MSGFEVVAAYVRRYPRITIAFVLFNVIGALIVAWKYGPLVVVSAMVAYALMTLVVKLMALLVLHERAFAFPRQNAPVILAIFILALLAWPACVPLLSVAGGA